MSSITERLILGIKNTILDDDERRILQRISPGGIILFDRNIESLPQLEALVDDINSILANKPFIAIDFEGGRVRRGSEFFGRLEMPAYYKGDKFSELSGHAKAVAIIFNDIGINLNFAPVADLDYLPLNPALTGRVYSERFEEVARYCSEFIDAFQGNGILCCLKHFPGLGSAVNDPHKAVSISCRPAESIIENDINSFRAGIEHSPGFLMTSHIILAELDNVIATYSEKVIHLARNIGFEGVIVSDDLSMGAVDELSPAERAHNALKAGHDMALICHDNDKYEDIAEYLEKNIDTLVKHGHIEALNRIRNAKNELP